MKQNGDLMRIKKYIVNKQTELRCDLAVSSIIIIIKEKLKEICADS